MAIFKDGGESKLVRVMSAFATKDLVTVHIYLCDGIKKLDDIIAMKISVF